MRFRGAHPNTIYSGAGAHRYHRHPFLPVFLVCDAECISSSYKLQQQPMRTQTKRSVCDFSLGPYFIYWWCDRISLRRKVTFTRTGDKWTLAGEVRVPPPQLFQPNAIDEGSVRGVAFFSPAVPKNNKRLLLFSVVFSQGSKPQTRSRSLKSFLLIPLDFFMSATFFAAKNWVFLMSPVMQLGVGNYARLPSKKTMQGQDPCLRPALILLLVAAASLMD